MDWTLITAGVAAVAAVASAVVAIVQAHQAAMSKDDANTARAGSQTARDESAALAKQATDAFIRQAEAQERANAMREDEMRPPPWTGPNWVKGQLYQVINTSKRTIVIDHFEVKPEGTQGMINIQPEDGNVYEYGDSFNYIASSGGMGGRSPSKLTAFWRFQDESDGDSQSLIIPLS